MQQYIVKTLFPDWMPLHPVGPHRLTWGKLRIVVRFGLVFYQIITNVL